MPRLKPTKCVKINALSEFDVTHPCLSILRESDLDQSYSGPTFYGNELYKKCKATYDISTEVELQWRDQRRLKRQLMEKGFMRLWYREN